MTDFYIIALYLIFAIALGIVSHVSDQNRFGNDVGSIIASAIFGLLWPIVLLVVFFKKVIY